MSIVIDFVRTFPSLTLSLIVLAVSVPWIIEIIEMVLRIRVAMGN
jgi:hypothetical protein